MLDRRQATLTEYEIESGTSHQIARGGRGPGDLFIPLELTQDADKVYVPMAGFRITVFDCSSKPCKEAGTVPVDKVNPMSLGVKKDGFVVLRTVPITSGSPEELASAGRAALTEIDAEGKIVSEFGDTYDFGKHWMLMDAFQRGFVRHFKNFGQSIFSNESFPLLYA